MNKIKALYKKQVKIAKVSKLMASNITRINNITKLNAKLYHHVDLRLIAKNILTISYINMIDKQCEATVQFSNKRHIKRLKSIFRRNLKITSDLVSLNGGGISSAPYFANRLLHLALNHDNRVLSA